MLNRVTSGTEPRKYTGKGQQTSRDRQGQRALENRRSLEADRQLGEGQAGEQGTGPVDRVKLKKMGSRLSGRCKTGVGGDGGRGAAGFPSVTRCHGGPVTLCDDRPLAGLPPPANCTPLEDWDVPWSCRVKEGVTCTGTPRRPCAVLRGLGAGPKATAGRRHI